MAYISTEQVKSIRDQIKNAYPNYKWSISRRHHSTVAIVLQESDLPIVGYQDVNPYWFKTSEKLDDKTKAVFTKVLAICNSVERCYDRNAGDMSADYGDSTYFIDLDIGKWDKPHKIIPAIGVRHPHAKVGHELSDAEMEAYAAECAANRATIAATPAPVIIHQWTHGSMLITEEAI
jgi:hypothetical protein